LSGKPLSARIGFAAQLLAYRATGRFPRGGSEISAEAATYIAAQSGAKVADLADYDWTGRSGRRHRAEILKHLGFRRAAKQDMAEASAWIGSELCSLGLPVCEMMERLLAWFAVRRVASPEDGVLASFITAARRAFEDRLFSTIAVALSEEQRRQLDASLADDDEITGFSGIKAGPGQPDLDNILLMARRLGFVKSLTLPVPAMPDPGDPFGVTPWKGPRLCPYHGPERSGSYPECGFLGDECERVVERQDGAEWPGRPPGVTTPPQHFNAVTGRKRLEASDRCARASGHERVSAPDPTRVHAAARPRVGRNALDHRIARSHRILPCCHLFGAPTAE